MNEFRNSFSGWRLGFLFGLSGVIVAILYLLIAGAFIKIFGLEITRYWSTMMFGAGVLLACTFALLELLWFAARLLGRLKTERGSPETEDL